LLGDILLVALSSESQARAPIRKVYSAFCKLSGEKKYADILSSLNFVNGPDVPVSEELEIALFRLCSSGLCTVDNPDFKYIRVVSDDPLKTKEKIISYWEHKESERAKEFKELAEDLAKNMK